MKYAFSLAAIFVVATVCVAQEIGSERLYPNSLTLDSGVQIEGEIKHSPGTVVGNLTVEISDPVRHSLQQSAIVSSGGDFQFSGVPVGMYSLRVLSFSGVPITEKIVSVEESVTQVMIELPVVEKSTPGGGTVSVAQLMHRVPSRAMKEYNNALKAVGKKDNNKAIEFLERAVAIDPDFVEAQTNLGRLYVLKHNPDKVLETFNKVLKINPRSEVAYTGSSIALIWLGRYADAEASARKALQIDPASPASHYFLGVSLSQEDKDDSEAVQHLDRCSTVFPDARIKAAKDLARHRDFSAATGELENYLKTGTATRRNEVTSWIRELKKAESSRSALR